MRQDLLAWHFWEQARGELSSSQTDPGAADEVQRVTQLFHSSGQTRVSARCGAGEKGGYRDFPSSLWALPFGRGRVRATNYILELREVICSQADSQLCVFLPLLPAPPPPFPPSSAAPVWVHQLPAPPTQGMGILDAMYPCAFRRGGAGFCPVPEEPLGLPRQPSHSTAYLIPVAIVPTWSPRSQFSPVRLVSSHMPLGPFPV